MTWLSLSKLSSASCSLDASCSSVPGSWKASATRWNRIDRLLCFEHQCVPMRTVAPGGDDDTHVPFLSQNRHLCVASISSALIVCRLVAPLFASAADRPADKASDHALSDMPRNLCIGTVVRLSMRLVTALSQQLVPG